MYVVWIVMAAAIFFSTSMSKLDIDTMNKEAEQQQTENIAETVKPETINMGMSVFLPTQPGEKVRSLIRYMQTCRRSLWRCFW